MKKSRIITPKDNAVAVERFLGENSEIVPIDSVIEHPKNARKRGSLARIIESIRTNGFFGSLLVQRSTNFIIKGNHTWKSCKALDWTTIRVVYLDLTDEEAERILLADNAATDDAGYDNAKLHDLLAGVATSSKLLLGTGWSMDDLEYLARMAGNKGASPEGEVEREGEDRPELHKEDVPDAVFPSDNDWGIPLLDIKKQADAVDLQVYCWGTQRGRRYTKSVGTYVHYTTDSHLDGVWRNPHSLINTTAINAVEANFTIAAQTPPSLALEMTRKKRWLARFWQSKGIKIFVDLNVAERFDMYPDHPLPPPVMNLLGVPKGWTAYCTRTGKAEIEAGATDREYERAVKHAGKNAKDLLFWCYGGTGYAKAYCEKKGWIWVMDDVNAARAGAS